MTIFGVGRKTKLLSYLVTFGILIPSLLDTFNVDVQLVRCILKEQRYYDGGKTWIQGQPVEEKKGFRKKSDIHFKRLTQMKSAKKKIMDINIISIRLIIRCCRL